MQRRQQFGVGAEPHEQLGCVPLQMRYDAVGEELGRGAEAECRCPLAHGAAVEPGEHRFESVEGIGH
jgi:hypothetical protein